MSPYERRVMRELAAAARRAKETDRSGCRCGVCVALEQTAKRAERLLSKGKP